MQEEGFSAAVPIPSYFLECLTFNVPNSEFQHDELSDDIRATIVYLWAKTEEAHLCEDFREVNRIKYLFRKSQPWTHEEASAFLLAAWQYVGFK